MSRCAAPEPIEEIVVLSINEELRTAAVWPTSICHRECTNLVRELLSKFIRNIATTVTDNGLAVSSCVSASTLWTTGSSPRGVWTSVGTSNT